MSRVGREADLKYYRSLLKLPVPEDTKKYGILRGTFGPLSMVPLSGLRSISGRNHRQDANSILLTRLQNGATPSAWISSLYIRGFLLREIEG